MPLEPLKLDQLPVEIIRRIAACGPCESVLALLKVNRALHHICNDRLVFQSILDNGNGLSRTVPIWQCTTLSPESPISLWACYSLADSKVRQMRSDLTSMSGGLMDNFVGVVPQLMVLLHPLIDHVNEIHLLERLKQYDMFPSRPNAQALSFCLAIRILSDTLVQPRGAVVSHALIPTDFDDLPTMHNLNDRFRDWRENMLDTLRKPIFSSIETTSRRSIVQATAEWYTIANKAVGIISYELRCSLHCNQFGNLGSVAHWSALVALVPPPSFLTIPFLSFMDLPPPFYPNSSKLFGTCHLRTMTSSEFLEDGEWAGYYCYAPLTGGALLFDTAMTRIHFVTGTRTPEWGSLSLLATGVDGIGSFNLAGEIDRETGKIVLRKHYRLRSGWGWTWHSMMTPFGIVGSWGHGSLGGWFWIWKTKWVGSDINLGS